MVIAADHALRHWVVVHRLHPLDPLMLAASGAAFNGIGWIIAAAVVSIRRRRADVLTGVAVALLLAGLAADGVLKHVIQRERPFRTFPAVAVLGPLSSGSSFPSGHAALSFAAATVLSHMVPSARIAWWTAAIVVGYSRLYLGVHYPLDVIGGAIVGAASGALALWLLCSVNRRVRSHS